MNAETAQKEQKQQTVLGSDPKGQTTSCVARKVATECTNERGRPRSVYSRSPDTSEGCCHSVRVRVLRGFRGYFQEFSMNPLLLSLDRRSSAQFLRVSAAAVA